MRYALLNNGEHKAHIIELGIDGSFNKIGEAYKVEQIARLIELANGSEVTTLNADDGNAARLAVSNAVDRVIAHVGTNRQYINGTYIEAPSTSADELKRLLLQYLLA